MFSSGAVDRGRTFSVARRASAARSSAALVAARSRMRVVAFEHFSTEWRQACTAATGSPGAAVTTGSVNARLMLSSSTHARLYDMPISRAAAEIEPVSRMLSSSVALSGPIRAPDSKTMLTLTRAIWQDCVTPIFHRSSFLQAAEKSGTISPLHPEPTPGAGTKVQI